jgi:hypothetical protein
MEPREVRMPVGGPMGSQEVTRSSTVWGEEERDRTKERMREGGAVAEVFIKVHRCSPLGYLKESVHWLL